MIVTVNTDASFSHKHKIGAFAFWIVCDQGRIQQSGVLKDAKNPSDAELKCIVNALHCVFKANYNSISKIIINSDALYVFNTIGLKKPAGSPERACATYLKKIYEQIRSKGNNHRKRGAFAPTGSYKDIYEFRHVKAHSGTEVARKWVNDWCDRNAKHQLGLAIKAITEDKQ